MDLDFNRKIWLEADRVINKESTLDYFNELFSFPNYIGNNLDALNDCLSEVKEGTTFLLTKECVRKLCDQEYGFKVLMLLGRVGDENPNLHISFRE